MTDETVVLEGAIAVIAALEANSRPVHRIVIEARVKHERDAGHIRKLADREQVNVETVSDEAIAALTEGRSHGGIAAVMGPRRFVPLEAIAAGVASPFVVMLDGIEDPYNFGQAVRAFYAAGADGLILRPRNWMSAGGIVARASAGASERMTTAIAETVEDAAAHFRARGVRVAVADKDRATPIYDADLTGGLLIVVGGEKRGVTRSFADAADLRLSIPYGRAYRASLGTVAAASALAFEVLRQRRK